jgi:hypothetical protein
VLALELAMDFCPVRLSLTTMTLLDAGRGEQPGLQCHVGHLLGQRPNQAGSLEALDGRAHRRGGHASPAGDLTDSEWWARSSRTGGRSGSGRQ